ncbi:MAG: alpha-glucan family phosphorylase [Desulfocucumaceae bacterium]
MFSFYTVSVVPEIPQKISRLKEIAYNFWFSWNEPAWELFSRLDKALWEEVYHNPVKFLLRVNPELLEKAAQDKDYLNFFGQVIASLDRYMTEDKWFNRRFPEYSGQVAYFSAEFGLHESHPIYSGGLGLLAGDHLKSASDLGVPLVAMGLLYRQGYFTQRIERNGWQEAEYPTQNFYEMPMQPVVGENGNDLTVSVDLPGRAVYVKVWKVIVGKVSLYLLDTDLSPNSREDRAITAQLYGGCRDNRISQEIILGIGGVRALRAMGIAPRMWHINEGHAAFLCLERIKEKVQKGIAPDVAVEVVKANTLFTTHTPVPAGHDVFSAEMISHYFGSYIHKMNLSREEFIRLGWDTDRQAFNMTVLALNLSDFKNGVSRLHGQISRQMFRGIYGNIPVEEVPITNITNGVHTASWMAPQIKSIMEKYSGPGWISNLNEPATWEKVETVPDGALWAAHRQLKTKLIEFARDHLRAQRKRNFETNDRLAEVEKYLNPDALLIGFARRFATYKRATLIFSDLKRLASLMNNPDRPVHIIFAGKAHPADRPGQEFIKRVIDISNMEPFRGKIVFLENYDINVARYLVRGVDVWLNNPRRPQEASGTSGMKAAVNGVLNFSVMDGWWPEAFNGKNGFSIGFERDYPMDDIQDREDTLSMYSSLENEIIPAYFYQEDGVPRKWVEYMKNSIKSVGLNFSSHRMVREYVEKFYIPASVRGQDSRKDNFALAEKLETFKSHLRQNWHQVSVCEVGNGHSHPQKAGENLDINSTIRLGSIQHHSVSVEIVYGGVKGENLSDLKTVPMNLAEQIGEGVYCYRGNLTLPQGAFGYTVRVRPANPDFAHKFDLPLVTWAGLN